MYRFGLITGLLLLTTSPCLAQTEAKPLLETWQAAYFEGLKVGHMHVLARELTHEGKKYIRTLVQMNLVLKRYGSIIPIRVDQTSMETEKGKVIWLMTTQYLAKDSKKKLTGVVKGDKLAFKSGEDEEMMLPWDASALGQYAQQAIFARKKVKTGDSFKVLAYELMLPGAITIRYTVKDNEKVDRLVTKKVDGKVKAVREPATLLRVEEVPDKIKIGDTEVQLPTKVVWLDSKLATVREQFQLPGIGAITLYTTDKKAALEEGAAPELLPDFGLNISIPLKQTIDKPYETTQATYKVTLKEAVGRVFAQDDRQKVRNKKEKSFELVVKAIRAPRKVEKPIEPGKEFLESNQFIDSANAKVKATARTAVGKEMDPWRKALKLEKWVHDNMKVSSAVGFPSAGKICQDLEGDCRQHAILLAALCRAAGIPSRTAVGLIYVREPGRSPIFGFHMWTEVAVEGQWLALDAILGEGGVGATHLKMSDHSWAKTATLAPLLPVLRALGNLQIEVVSSK